MKNAPVRNSVWHWHEASAAYDDGRRQARVDLLCPARGLHEWRGLGEIAAPPQLLGVDVASVAADELSLPESYARVDDLVATYPQTAARPFRLQLYWRRVEIAAGASGHDVAAFDLEVSINTDLLDTRPTIDVVSTLGPATVVRTAADRSVLIRPVGATWSYFETSHPADDCATAVDAREASTALRRTLFGRFLEKGVIVRARLRGAILPRTNDEALACALREEFLNAPLPLTT